MPAADQVDGPASDNAHFVKGMDLAGKKLVLLIGKNGPGL
jgi:hypothetical protein